MIPDLTFVTNSFNRFNAVIFNSSLPLPRIVLTRARTFRGKLCYMMSHSFLKKTARDFELRISTVFDLPTEEWEDVVIHEMIHLHIAHKKIKDSSSHGPVFRQIMCDINHTYGRNIVVSARATEKQLDADNRIRGHYVCLAKFNDGRLGVAPVTKSNIFSLWEEFQKFPEVQTVKWVGTLDPWFNRFPRVRKPKLYLAKREEVALHLKDGKPLERIGNIIRVISSRCSPDELLP